MKLALLAPLTLLLLAFAGRAQSAPTVLQAKHLSKAESLVIHLENFASFANGHPDKHEYNARLGKLSAAVSNAIGNFPESHIKENLATALYFFGQASSTSSGFETSQLRPCPNQRPCINLSTSRRDFLLSRARLHLDWAKAELARQRSGVADPAVVREMEEQQKGDLELAEQALSALKRLEADVVVYSSLGEFEAEQRIARVPYETFQEHLRETVVEVRRILSWLPRNALRTELGNALSSYQDGAFWWERVNEPRIIDAAHPTLETNRAPRDSAYLETVPYTIVINWRNANRSLKRAEALVSIPTLKLNE